jgi:hypothetical protein
MWYVDQHDRETYNYKLGRVSKKWWIPIFWHLIEIAVCNSYAAYIKLLPQNKTPLKKKEYRECLAKELTKDYVGRSNFPPSPQKRLADKDHHFCKMLDKGERRTCSGKKCRNSVRTYCVECSLPYCESCFCTSHEIPSQKSKKQKDKN